MNLGRRVVVCVAAALAVAVVAVTVNGLLAPSPGGGWSMYTVDGEQVVSSPSRDGDVLRAGSIWLLAVAVWLLISWWLFRPRQR